MQVPDGLMSNTSRYAALDNAPMDDEDEGEAYELDVVHKPIQRSRPTGRQAVVMPERYHRALDAYLLGRAGSEDSDGSSDGETTLLDGGDGEYEDNVKMSIRKEKRNSLDMIMDNNRKQESQDDDEYDDRDLEAQPAWMRGSYKNENNVLRVRCLLYLTVFSRLLTPCCTINYRLAWRYLPSS